MQITQQIQAEHICGECGYSNFLCHIITADNGWRFIVCAYGDRCFNKSVARAKEVDTFWAKSDVERLRYFASDVTEDARTKDRLYNEYHTKTQDAVLLECASAHRLMEYQ